MASFSALLLGLLATAAPVQPGLADQAKAAFQAGQVTRDGSAQRASYARGITLARAALAQNPDDPGGLLWLAANLGAEALTHGKVYALRIIGELERTLLRLEKVAPTYDNAAAARALGRLYHKAPAVISVGSSKKAADYLGRALARAPRFPGNQAFAAEFFADQDDCARAVPLARALQATPDLDRYGHDAKEWRAIAKDVLEDECD